jgi:AraC family transcriptional regulator of adaptative response / DNA-3-methyladenine glycosylase II
MDPSSALRYRALETRDARFDGTFFVGVKSTGVYCRPICPARTPRRRNVEFFECAAAAEGAGYRPCRRCRPETAPGTPAWVGSSTTVSRALRLIADGALDEGGVEDLAVRLGVGGRHLRRLFARHLGASPVSVAQTRRVHFARELLDRTDLPMQDVAFGAGFSSVRRFNTAVRSTFGLPPSALRELVRNGERAAARTGLVLRLPYRPPYDWDGILEHLARRAVPRVEATEGGVYRRTFRVDGRSGGVSVRPDPEGRPFLVARVTGDVRRDLLTVAERIRRIFDLGADPARIARSLSADPWLEPRVRARPGLRVPGAWDPFELAVRAILGQQISVKGATTLAGRLVEAFGDPIPGGEGAPPGPDRLFPSAAALAEADVARIGMPRQRADAVRELARRVASGRLPLSWGGCPEETRDALLLVPGVGEWTADYIAMRGLGQTDAFPAGDLGARRALAADVGELPSPREVSRRAETWRPWRAYATLHLWTTPPPKPRKT